MSIAKGRLILAWLSAGALYLGAATVHGQVTLVGIVKADDSPPLIPADWTVDITPILLPGDQEETAIPSKREIFVYFVPQGWKAVDLVFSRIGYASVSVPVRLEGLKGAYRIDRDVTLPKIIPLSGPAPGELTLHLNEQAEIAARAGPKAIEAFQWNLQLYENVYEGDPAATREIEAFRLDPQVMELITPEEGSDIALYGKMAKWQFGLQPTLNSRDVLEVVGDTSRPLALRAEAIRILSSLKMTPGEARDVRGQLKVLVNNSDLPELNAAALVGLARVGDPEDMQIIINATRSSDSQIAQAATEAIASASEPEALGILTTLSQTHADERVRAAAVHGLESRDLAASVDDLVTIVQTDASPLVRREAVQALGEMEIPRELKADVDAALETAKADVSPEVRLEAERVLVRPRQ